MDFYFLNHVTKSENIVCPTPVCHYLLCIYLGHYILYIITYIRATVTVTHKLTQLEFLTKTFFSLCKMTEKIKFLCGNFESDNLIYGISFGEYDWHYFEMKDTLASEHSLLPDRLHFLICTLSLLNRLFSI